MAIVHDLAESIVGDISPKQGIPKDVKHQMELDAMNTLCKDLLKNSSESIFELWMEYEKDETAEARFVKDVDKFEMIVQAFEYEKKYGIVLEQFFESTSGKFQHPMVVKMVSELNEKRALLHSSKE